MLDNLGKFYTAELALNSITTFNPLNGETTEDLTLLARDNETMFWPDMFSFDDSGHFWVTCRGWPLDETRNYIVRIFVGTKSYLYL